MMKPKTKGGCGSDRQKGEFIIMKKSRKKFKEIGKAWGLIILILFIVMVSIFLEVRFSFNDTEYTVTVTGKERIVEESGDKELSSKYLVFADDENGNSLVFENTDCLIRWKFNSSNIQGKLKEGHTYKITVIGIRIPIFSMYQNIIDVEEIGKD